MVALVAAYAIHKHYADRDKARLHENKTAAQLEKLLPLDEHVRANLENFRTTLVETLKAQYTLTKDLDDARHKTASKAAGTILGRRLPQP